MSVYKSMRNTSNIKYLQDNSKLRKACIRLLVRIPKRYNRYFDDSILHLCAEIAKFLHKAEAIHLTKYSEKAMFDLRLMMFEEAKITLKTLGSEVSFIYDVIRDDNANFALNSATEKLFFMIPDIINSLIIEANTAMKRDRERWNRWNKKRTDNNIDTET